MKFRLLLKRWQLGVILTLAGVGLFVVVLAVTAGSVWWISR